MLRHRFLSTPAHGLRLFVLGLLILCGFAGYKRFSAFARNAQAVSQLRSAAVELWRYADEFGKLPSVERDNGTDWQHVLLDQRSTLQPMENSDFVLPDKTLFQLRAVVRSDGAWFCEDGETRESDRAMLIAIPNGNQPHGDLVMSNDGVQLHWSASPFGAPPKLSGAIICSFAGQIRTIPQNADPSTVYTLLASDPDFTRREGIGSDATTNTR